MQLQIIECRKFFEKYFYKRGDRDNSDSSYFNYWLYYLTNFTQMQLGNYFIVAFLSG